VVDTSLKRMEYKMRTLDETTVLLRHERGQLERMRHQIFAEKLTLEKRRIQQASSMPLTGGYSAATVGGVPVAPAPADATSGVASASSAASTR